MFTLPKLDYSYDALKGYISKDIMELHYTKHHQGYVDKLNAALEGHTDLQSKTIEELLTNLDDVPEDIRIAVRNQGGGHYNHTRFWQWLSPEGGSEPSGQLANDLKEKFGSFQNFANEFAKVALSVFGSGWTWLQPDLSLTKSANQDSPLMEGEVEPILGLDVWEHAYYLDYKSNRADYIAAWWNIVNWSEVARRYEKSLA